MDWTNFKIKNGWIDSTPRVKSREKAQPERMEDKSKRDKLMNADDGTVHEFQRRTTRMIGRMAGFRGSSRKNKVVDESIASRADVRLLVVCCSDDMTCAHFNIGCLLA